MAKTQQPVRRYAKSIKTLAMALGYSTSKEQVRFMNEWKFWPGFPAKHRHGFDIEKVAEWLVLAEVIERIQRHKAIAQMGNIKSKPSKSAIDLLGSAVKEPSGNSVEPESDTLKGGHQAPVAGAQVANPVAGMADVSNCNTQTQLAVKLARYYQGKISYDITDNEISCWKRGDRLPAGAPLPPPKVGNYFVTADWVAWFDKHMMSTWGLQANPQGELLPDLARRAREAEYNQQIDSAARERFAREKEMGKFVEKAPLGRIAMGVGLTIRAEITKVETVLPLGLEEDLQEMKNANGGMQNLEALIPVIMEKFRVRCQHFNDGLQAAIPKALLTITTESSPDGQTI